jgi:hypothetical protein
MCWRATLVDVLAHGSGQASLSMSNAGDDDRKRFKCVVNLYVFLWLNFLSIYFSSNEEAR